MLKSLRMWTRALLGRRATEHDLDDEMLFHLEQQAKLYVQQGYTREEAERRARIDFGSVDNAKEQHRDGRGTRSFEDVLADVRYSFRSLWRDRALTLAGVATLALGIGATTAVFSAVNAVMLRDLPFRDANQLVSAWEENTDRNWYKSWVAPANYLDWRERMKSFGGQLAAYTDNDGTVTLQGVGEPVLLNITSTTGNFFSVLGTRPLLGHGFDSADDWEGGQRHAMISARVWRTYFKSDTGIVGKSMSFGGARPWLIAGVMPDGFAFPNTRTDVWVPMLWPKATREQVFFRRAHWLRVAGRLKPGVTPEAAHAEMQVVVRQLEKEYPATNTRMYGGITPIREWIVGNTKRPLVVLLASAGVLLLIACANVGNLLLVHAVSRSRDVSLRFALGATRQRVAQQAITESLVLSTIGGLAGFALGWMGARGLLAMQPAGMLPVTDISVDYRVLAFTIGLTTLSGLTFGLAPAMIATRQSPADALNASGRTFTGGKVRRWSRQLVVAEVALAVLLMVGAGLLLRSYDRIANVPPGFDAQGVLTVSLGIPASRYDSAAKVVNFYNTLLERTRALPGVERVAAVRQLPATSSAWSSSIAVKGRPPMQVAYSIVHREVQDDYFRVMRVPLLKGRTFDATDGPDAPPVVVINEALAKQFFPNEDPIGQQICNDQVPDSTSLWRTIVGVVGSERQASLVKPPEPEIFAPFAQDWTRFMSLVIRVQPGRDPVTLAQPVRRVVREMDSLLAINSIRPMTDVHAAAMARERFISLLVLVFAVTGVALALVGVFGVLAQLVQARWRELGIRMALGAQRSDVRRMVLLNGMRLMSIGIAVGLIVALGATQVLTSLLFEVSATDAVTYVGVAVLVIVVGLVAAWIPAWRASSANPAVTLRAE